MNNYLITGSSGYIGQSLCNLLKVKKIPYISFDIKNNKQQDIRNKKEIKKYLKNKNISHIIHAAALSGVEKHLNEYDNYLDTNVVGTYNLLEVARELKIKNFIFTSSCSVYGNNNNCKESDKLLSESFYGLSKILCEEMIKFYGRKHGINYQILRIFNVIGHGINSEFQKNRLIPKILEKIKKNEPIDIYLQSNGIDNQIRDFVDIKYVIDIIYELLINPFTNKIFNVASGKGNSVSDIVSLCQNLTNKIAFWNFTHGRDGDCDFQTANIRNLKTHRLFKDFNIKDIINDIIKHE